MLSHQHEIVWLYSRVSQKKSGQQTLNLLSRLTFVLFLVDFFVFLPNVDLDVIYVLINISWAVTILFTLLSLSFIITSEDFELDHIAYH